MHSTTSTLIRGDGAEALKILQLLSSRVELKNIFRFCCFGRPAALIRGVYGGFLLKGKLQLLSSRVVQHYYKIQFFFNALGNINIDSGGRGGGIENLAVTFLAGGANKNSFVFCFGRPATLIRGVWGASC